MTRTLDAATFAPMRSQPWAPPAAELEMVARYRSVAAQHPEWCKFLTADIVLISRGGEAGQPQDDDDLSVLLVERAEHPFLGCWALPGGFVDAADPNLLAAAERELREETGLDAQAEGIQLEQLGAYYTPDRDPRGSVATVAFVAIVPPGQHLITHANARRLKVKAGSDARNVRWWPRSQSDLLADRLAFDHATIINDAAAWATRHDNPSRDSEQLSGLRQGDSQR